MNTSGNTILITGGTSGIGFAFAEQFLELGNTVIICGRREDRLKLIKDKHPGMVTRVCDVARQEQREELARWVLKDYPALNIFFNNAGIQLHADLTKPVNLDRIRSEIEINLIAPIHLASLFAPHLASKKKGAIFNISSGLAFAPLAFIPMYCATKAAMHSFTLSLPPDAKHTGESV